jgi:hypothetical protein
MMLKSLFVFLALASCAYGDTRLRYVFYFGTVELVQTATYNVNNLQTILSHPAFVNTQQTVLFHYSVGQSLSSVQIHDLITSYIFSRDYNLVIVGYEDNDVVSTDNAVSLALGIAQSTVNLCDAGFSSSQLYFIGFGLGAHIMGRASRQVPTQSAGRHTVGRLTGLDPLSLGIIAGNQIGRISQNDALFVDTIHTESNSRGDNNARGHVWYFVNGGIAQPMCTQPLPGARADCSHVLALTLWAESVRTLVPTFPSLSCATWELFLGGACNANSVAFMGRTTNISVRGSHMVSTNLTPPFSRNVATP